MLDPMADETITREALNRLEARANERVAALEELMNVRFEQAKALSQERLTEILRRLDDLNNSHRIAAEEKKATDQAALRVQERSVTKDELQTWKDEVNRALNLAQGAATARAAMLSVGVGMAVLVINLVIRYLGTKP